MKTDKQLCDEIVQQIKAQAPKRARAKKRTRVFVTALCALAFLAPAFLLFLQKTEPYTTPTPKPSSDYSSSDEIELGIEENRP